ncbi:hypothetical protein BV25DRAFT_371890 [Artomyces pyxidatus]|uniref:Uncharacterized protein n=1 Tax=Artomyces pyxidatus TaxID=48021 RepID=A0ACB8T7D4_9AGAM|nr:hypothetical protein BV25DRAFT_371890 [Artomyces pyxidatus]
MSAVYNSSTQIVDDNSPSISYSPPTAWSLGGTDNEYDGTTHGFFGINTAKSTASFQFNGSAVEVHGTVGPTDGVPSATYQIDNNPPVTVVNNVEAVTAYNLLFYKSPPLDPTATHTLVITPIGNDSDTHYWLDYILFTPPSGAITLPGTPIAAGSSSSISTASTSPAGTSSRPGATTSGVVPTPTPAPSTGNIGAIVGGTIGGFVGLVVLVALFYLFKTQRRFQRYYWSKRDIDELLGPELPPPVQYPKQYPDRGMHTFTLSTSSIPLMSAVEGRSGVAVSHASHGSRRAPGSATSHSSCLSDDTLLQSSTIPVPFTLSQQPASATTGKGGRLPPERPVTPSRYHSDGGIRLASGDSEVPSSEHPPVDIPPAYGRY